MMNEQFFDSIVLLDAENTDNTMISITKSNNILAILNGVEASAINSADFILV